MVYAALCLEYTFQENLPYSIFSCTLYFLTRVGVITLQQKQENPVILTRFVQKLTTLVTLLPTKTVQNDWWNIFEDC